jgi:hypothetical protein
MLLIQPGNHLGGFGCQAHHPGEQQLGFFGMVQSLREFVDVKQHGAHHIKIILPVMAGATRHHHADRAQHRGQCGVFVVNDLNAAVVHLKYPVCFR